MRLNELSPAPGSTRSRKRLGRGTGSGNGKTSGRGHKGAGARSGSGAHTTYEGGQMPLQRRLPRLKGMARGRHTVARPNVYAPVNVGELSELSGDEIGVEEIKAAGVVRKKEGWSRSWDGEIGGPLGYERTHFSKSGGRETKRLPAERRGWSERC